MARTTVIEVSKILDNTNLDDSVLRSFINTANSLVTTYLGDSGLGETILTEIEKWWAAHLVSTTRERTAKSEKVGDVSVEYTGEFGKDLESSPYGQMVLQLDSTGILSKLGKRRVYFKAIKSFDD
jgi:hypothetical protein